jgi:hypothetical protein
MGWQAAFRSHGEKTGGAFKAIGAQNNGPVMDGRWGL